MIVLLKWFRFRRRLTKPASPAKVIPWTKLQAHGVAVHMMNIGAK